MATERQAVDAALEDFYQDLNGKNMDALWRRRIEPQTVETVKAPYQPCRWLWKDLEPRIWRAAELVKPGPEAERRVIILKNPGVAPAASATHTLSWNLQLVMPGEQAPSHRHTPTAIRFVLRSKGAVTLVNGEPVTMRPGDLILTPNWSWHGHVNDTDEPAMWIDGLDVPLVHSLRQALQEPHPDGFEAASKPPDASMQLYGTGWLRPWGAQDPGPISPMMTYPWSETEPALRRLAEGPGSPFDDVIIEYTNPTTGGHVLPTLSCHAQLLRSGVHTQAHRHSYSVAYHVFQGRGASIIDGARLDWEEGDFFVLPPWAWHEHLTTGNDEAVLFSIADIPVLEALQLYREVPYEGGHQEVVTTYEERFG